MRAVTVREREWTDDDVAHLIASRNQVRGSHGHLLEESTSPDADPFSPTRKYRYESDLPRVDWAERTRRLAEDAYRENLPEGFKMHGYFFPVRKVEL